MLREPVRVSCDSEVVDADVKGGSGDGISCFLAENCLSPAQSGVLRNKVLQGRPSDNHSGW